MTIDYTLRIADVLLAVAGLILIPSFWALGTNLLEMNKALQKLNLLVLGTEEDPSTGIVVGVREIKREVIKHGHRLIALELEAGVKVNERT